MPHTLIAVSLRVCLLQTNQDSGTSAFPFWEMANDNGLSSNEDSYCLAKEGEVYVVCLKNGGETD